MAKIERVSHANYEYDVRFFVTYESGTVREYPADKLPKTVTSWIEKNQIETVNPAENAAKVATPEEPETIETVETVTTETEITPATAEEPETAETKEPETITAEEPAKVGSITAVEPEQMEEPETATPAAIVPIISGPVKPAAVTKYKPASEVVAFGLCMVLMYAALAVRYGVELLIIAAQNVWSRREEYAEKVRKAYREEIKPAAVLVGYIATDTATTAAGWTVETGKQIIIAVTIIAFMVNRI